MIYTCPGCQAQFQTDVTGVVVCPTCGHQVRVAAPVPAGTDFDRAGRGQGVSAFFETVKRSIADPIPFFESVAAGSGNVRPWIYAVVISTFVFLIAAAYQAGFQALALSMNIAAEVEKAFFPLAALSIPLTVGIVAIIGIVGIPIFTTLMLFMQSAICHGCLLVLGAARRDYWATFRTLCYANGPQLFQVVPLLGGMVGPIWQIVLIVIGLKVVHKTSYGRSALAVFLPTILCCGVILIIGIMILGGIAGALVGRAH